MSTLRKVATDMLPLQWRLRREVRESVQREQEIALVNALLRAGDVFVDVGANNGAYTAAACLQEATVIAIEPLAELADGLRAKYGTRVRVEQVACSPDMGTATLHVPQRADGRAITSRSSLRADANNGYEHTGVTVATRPLDSLAVHADMLKIDVEGFEVPVLLSAERLLSRSRPTVLVEVEARHHEEDPWEAFSVLVGHGYAGYWRETGRQLRALSQFKPDVHQRSADIKSPDVALSSCYVNNFLFIHPDRGEQVSSRLAQAGWQLN